MIRDEGGSCGQWRSTAPVSGALASKAVSTTLRAIMVLHRHSPRVTLTNHATYARQHEACNTPTSLYVPSFITALPALLCIPGARPISFANARPTTAAARSARDKIPEQTWYANQPPIACSEGCPQMLRHAVALLVSAATKTGGAWRTTAVGRGRMTNVLPVLEQL